jgi:hypothetical protein
MLYDRNTLPMEERPGNLRDDGIAGGGQATCVFGMFDESTARKISMIDGRLSNQKVPGTIQFFASGAMGSCCAVFLRCHVMGPGGGILGAVAHLDSNGDVGAVFLQVLRLHRIHSPRAADTYIVRGPTLDTAQRALNCLVDAGFTNVRRYSFGARGSAGMDFLGTIFNPDSED